MSCKFSSAPFFLVLNGTRSRTPSMKKGRANSTAPQVLRRCDTQGAAPQCGSNDVNTPLLSRKECASRAAGCKNPERSAPKLMAIPAVHVRHALLALAVQPRQVFARRRLDSRGLRQPAQKLLIALARVAPHESSASPRWPPAWSHRSQSACPATVRDRPELPAPK